jgi:hypothetical protein
MKNRLILVAAFAAVSLASACRKPEPPPFNTDLPTQAVMAEVIDPAATELWQKAGEVDTLQGTEYLAPTTDEGWARAAAMSSTVLEAANSLMLPGRVRHLSKKDEDWTRFAQALAREASASRDAAQNHDSAKLYATGATLYQACVGCHQKYLLPFIDKKRTYRAPGAPGGPEHP